MHAIHTHISTDSRDCDGRYTNTWVNDQRIQFHDLPLTYGIQGNFDSNFDESADGEQLLYRFTASCPTEEGYRSVTAYECESTNCDRKGTHRDHTAESMGY